VYTYSHTYIHTCVHSYIHIQTNTHTQIPSCMYIFTYIWESRAMLGDNERRVIASVHLSMCMYVYVCVYVCVCVPVYITQKQAGWPFTTRTELMYDAASLQCQVPLRHRLPYLLKCREPECVCVCVYVCV